MVVYTRSDWLEFEKSTTERFYGNVFLMNSSGIHLEVCRSLGNVTNASVVIQKPFHESQVTLT